MLEGNNRFETAQHLDPVFGNFENFEESPPPPACRVLVITDAMRAADAAKQAERHASAVSSWPIKAELKIENLLKTKPKPRPAVMAQASAQPRVSRQRLPPSGKTNCECGNQLRSDNTTGLCKGCREKPVLEPLRECAAEGCQTKLQRTNEGDLCGRCKFLKTRHDGVVAQQAKCAGEGCQRMLRNGAPRRPDNLCTVCGRRVDRKAGKMTAAAAAKRLESVQIRKENEMKRAAEMKLCTVASCNTLTRAASGRCAKDWAPRKGTKMRDGSVWGGIAKKVVAPKKSAKPAATPAVAAVFAPAGMVQLNVPEIALDRFWAALAAADKARIFTAELSR